MTDHADCRTPGQFIEKLLAKRGWSQRVLAVVMGVNETLIHRLMTGKKDLDGDTALLLAEVFEEDAGAFMDLQASFELSRARLLKRPDSGREQRARLFKRFPVAEMVKRGWLRADDIRDVSMVELALTEFFMVASIDEVVDLRHAAKKTNVAESTTPVQLAWLHRVQQLAREMRAPKYTNAALVAAIEKLRALLPAPEELPTVPRILTEAGIRFLIVEGLPGAKIDGVCLWLDDASPVVAMTVRHDRIDNFWFVLRHELEHVLQGHGRDVITTDTDLEGATLGVSEEERVANEAAAEFCVPQASMRSFLARKPQFIAERDVLNLAQSLQTHPGLVAGQLQRHTGRYDRFRAHQVKVRAIVATAAVVDGWSNVAPTAS